MKGDAYGGRWNGVEDDSVEAIFAEEFGWEGSEESELDAEAEPSSSSDSALEVLDLGSWRKRIAAGSTEIISPGARRVLAFVCWKIMGVSAVGVNGWEVK